MRIKESLFAACMILLLQGIPFDAMSQKTDSLLNRLQANPPDTIKVDLLLALHQTMVAKDTAQATSYLQKAIVLSSQLSDKKRMANSYLAMCKYVRKRGQLQQAKQAIAQVDKLLPYLHEMVYQANYFFENGLIHFYEGTYHVAVNNYLQALANYEKIGDIENIAECYNRIGSAYWELEELDNALAYYQKAVKLFEEKDEKKIARFLGNIGLIYRAKKDYDKALAYYQRSLEINQQYDYKLDAAIDLQNIGILYQKMGDILTALKYLKASNKISVAIDDQIGVLYSNHGIAAMYAELGNFPQAIKGLEQALQTAKQLGLKEEIKNLYESFSDVYEEMGQYQLAYTNRISYELWKDSIANENYLKQVKELEITYETEKKDQQITLLAKEKEIQAKETQRQSTLKKASFGGILLVSLLAGMIFYMSRQKLKNQKLLSAKDNEIKEVNYKRQMSELEMKALQAQINPHFLFNCMNSINRMILEGDNENASVYLSKFSKLVRLILENAESTKVSLQSELTLLESYIQLEALRFKGKIDYIIKVDASIDPDDTYLPSMVLQPFVENAIWHGLMHKNGDSEKGVIEVSIKEENNRLYCIIEDNGVGREKARELQQQSVLKKKSLGMKITEERLRLLSKEQVEQLVRITDLKDAFNHALGTRVEINIPVS
jgi:tetratricopeptide (TPR) repeat protein